MTQHLLRIMDLVVNVKPTDLMFMDEWIHRCFYLDCDMKQVGIAKWQLATSFTRDASPADIKGIWTFHSTELHASAELQQVSLLDKLNLWGNAALFHLV